MIQIYKISFPDGSAYVGQTRRPVSFRLAQHRGSNPCNSVLYRKLLIMEPTVEILSRHRKQEVADREERKQIMRLEKPINRYVEGRQINKNPEAPPLRNNKWSRKRNRRERPKYSRKASGYNVCSWCWRKLPVSEFYSDRCRSVGLSSRCRECSKIQNKACRDAIKKKRILPPPTCGLSSNARRCAKRKPVPWSAFTRSRGRTAALREARKQIVFGIFRKLTSGT